MLDIVHCRASDVRTFAVGGFLPGWGAFAVGGFPFPGGTLLLRAFLRGGEAFIVAKAISPPRAPPLRPRSCSAFWRCGSVLAGGWILLYWVWSVVPILVEMGTGKRPLQACSLCVEMEWRIDCNVWLVVTDFFGFFFVFSDYLC